ncbi:MAG: autotransporter-associated beta strand repeat-containing protein, partial [Akkermansia sp.]|nr:autotransporter-associated beta strand repeat-containing protein [Akkermansia sp.]
MEDLKWIDETLYLVYDGTNYSDDSGGGSSIVPTLLIATWTNEAGDGLWNGTSLNWEQEEVDYAYKDGVQVVFGDEGAGTVTLVGDIAPSSVLVDSKEDYTWNADSTAGGKLTGSMSITKKGTGTLSINTENDYTGGTTIQGGTVVAGTATALGIGTVSLTDATLKIAAEGVENALTTAGTSSILVQDGGSLALQSAITNAATGILTLSGKVDVSGIGELTKLEATRIDVNGNTGESGFARAEGYTLQVVNGGKVLGSGAELVHSGLPTGLTLVLGENGLATAGAATDFTKYVIDGSHAVSVSEILKDVPQDSALSSIEMSGGTLLVDAATDALAATGGTVTLSRDVKLGGTMSGGMLMAQAGEIAATLSGNTAVVVSGAVTLSVS